MCLAAIAMNALLTFFATLGLDRESIHVLADLLAGLNAMDMAQVPQLLQLSLSIHFEATFSDMRGTHVFGTAKAGTRPGHPFADLIFHFALGLVFKRVGVALAHEGLVPQYPILASST